MKIKSYLDERPVEFLSNLFTLVWGIWVLNPLTEAFTNVPVFVLIKSLAPEWAWGATFFIVGVFGFLSMRFLDTFIRRFISQIEVFLFITLGIATGIANFQSPATVIYLIIAFCGLLSHNSILIEEKGRAEYGKHSF